MLKPYVCIACEKVIIAKDTDVPSLINLFTKIGAVIPRGAEIPSNAVAPKEWAVFSGWDVEPGDEHHPYILCTQILYPDKTQFAEIVRSKLVIQANKRAQMVVNIVGFPIGQIGEYVVRTWVELNNETVCGPIEFGIGVEITRQEPPQSSEAANSSASLPASTN